MNRSLATMGITRTSNSRELQQKNNDVPWDLNSCHWILALSYLRRNIFNTSRSLVLSIQIHVWTPHWNVRPSPLVTGHSFRLDARDVGLTDAQLNACRVCMGHVHVEAVDLEVQSSACETVLGFGDVFASEMVVVDADSPKKYVNIPSEKYIYVHIYVCICVYTYLCKMDERRSYASLS